MVKNFAQTLTRGLESALKVFLEDGPNKLAVKPAGGGVQGREITSHLDRIARKRLVCLDKERRFIPDNYRVLLHPTDYDNLRPLLDDIRRDALTHLEELCKQLDCTTKSPVSVEFSRTRRGTDTARLDVEAGYKMNEEHTVLVAAGETPEQGLTFQAEGIALADAEWAPFHKVVLLLQKGSVEEAHALLDVAGLDRQGHLLGRLLRALAFMMGGRFLAGMRLLNTSPELANSEHGHYLRALGSLAVGDGDRASHWLSKVMQERLNPMGALIQALLAQDRGLDDERDAFLTLADQDPVVGEIRNTWFPTMGNHRSQDKVNKVLELRDDGRQLFLTQGLPVSLSFGTDGGDFFPVPLGFGNLHLLQKGSALKLRGSGLRVNDVEVESEGVVLADGDRIYLQERVLTYAHIQYHGPWSRSGRRNFEHDSHQFRENDAVWFFSEESVFTLGRESHCGNDIVLEGSKQVSGQGHAEISFENGSFFIRDLGSTNGVARNGMRLKALEAECLLPGDRIHLGNRQLSIGDGPQSNFIPNEPVPDASARPSSECEKVLWR